MSPIPPVATSSPNKRLSEVQLSSPDRVHVQADAAEPNTPRARLLFREADEEHRLPDPAAPELEPVRRLNVALAERVFQQLRNVDSEVLNRIEIQLHHHGLQSTLRINPSQQACCLVDPKNACVSLAPALLKACAIADDQVLRIISAKICDALLTVITWRHLNDQMTMPEFMTLPDHRLSQLLHARVYLTDPSVQASPSPRDDPFSCLHVYPYPIHREDGHRFMQYLQQAADNQR